MTFDREQWRALAGQPLPHDDRGAGPYALPEPPTEEKPPQDDGPAPRRRRVPAGVFGFKMWTSALVAVMVVSVYGIPLAVASQDGRELVAHDAFHRSQKSGWGQTEGGQRWNLPSGTDGVASRGDTGIMRLSKKSPSHDAYLSDVRVRNVAVAYGFKLDRLPEGRGVRVMSLVRRSSWAAYRARVRIDGDGRTWMSIMKVRGGVRTRLGDGIRIKSWRYSPGETMHVRVMAVGNGPTQIRMKVWPSSRQEPSRWQLVRDDARHGDIGTGGSVGLRSHIGRGITHRVKVRFTELTVQRLENYAFMPETSKRTRKARPTKAERPGDRAPDRDPTPKPKPRVSRGPAPAGTEDLRLLRVATVEISEDEAVVQWTLNHAGTGQVEFGRTSTYTERTKKESSFDLETHVQTLQGLEPGTRYHYRVVSTDAQGETTRSKDKEFVTAGDRVFEPAGDPTAKPDPTRAPDGPKEPDPTPKPDPTQAPDRPKVPDPTVRPDDTDPTISAITVVEVATTEATVSWTLDEPATGQVEFGPNKQYGSQTKRESSFDYKTHAQRLRDLEPGTKYHFRVVSEDAAGNVATSADQTFTTAASDPPPVTDEPAPGSSPTPTPAVTPTASPSPTATPTAPAATPTASPTAPAATPTASPTAPAATPTASPSPSPSPTPSPSPSPTASPSPSPSPTPRPTPTPTPTPRPVTPADEPATGAFYGPGVGWDAKGNIQIDGTNGRPGLAAIRFRAGHDGTVRFIRHQFKTNVADGYAAGDGGVYRVGIQSGTNSAPSGEWLGQPVTWDPPLTSTGDGVVHTFPNGPTLQKGTVYWIVWKNIDPNPAANWGSLNFPYTFITSIPNPRQPRYPDDIFAVFTTYNSDWKLDSRHFPSVDIEYANGNHDGHAGIGIYSQTAYGVIDGTAEVRERFTPSSKVTGLTEVGWRLRHVSGTGTADIRATLKVAGGETLGTAILKGSQLSSGALPTGNGTSGEWVTGTLSGGPHTLQAGVEYVLVLSTSSGSSYFSRVILMRDGTTSSGEHEYDDFAEGRAEKSANGSSWSYLGSSSGVVHHQFYMR